VEILDDDSSYSTELENEVDGDVNVTIEYMSLQRLKELSESRNGIEITEVSEREVWFVQRSWRDLSFRSLDARLPSVSFSSMSTVGQQELTSIREMDIEEVAQKKSPADTKPVGEAMRH
jgi:hypothetical protein